MTESTYFYAVLILSGILLGMFLGSSMGRHYFPPAQSRYHDPYYQESYHRHSSGSATAVIMLIVLALCLLIVYNAKYNSEDTRLQEPSSNYLPAVSQLEDDASAKWPQTRY